MANPIPPELANPILEIATYILTFIGGVIAKWLQSRKSKTNPK